RPPVRGDRCADHCNSHQSLAGQGQDDRSGDDVRRRRTGDGDDHRAAAMNTLRAGDTLGFDQLEIGDTFLSGGRTMTEADIMGFAGLSGDFNPLHTDEEWVTANTPFTRRIAHGLLVLAISSGLRTPGLDGLNIVAYLNV